MNTIYHILAVAWKELQVILKDRGGLAMMLLLPLLLGSMQSAANVAMTGDGDEPAILLDACLVNEDAGAFGQEVARAIEGIKELNIETYSSAGGAEEQVATGEAVAAIVIPADFTQDIDAYTPTTIDVILDPAQPEAASIVTGIMNQVVAEVTIWGEVQYGIRTLLEESGALAGASPEEQRAIGAQTLGVIMTRLNEMRSTPAIAVVSEDLEGATVEGGLAGFIGYIFPAYTVMFIFLVITFSAPGLLREREEGTLRRLTAAPVSRAAIIAGKMLAYMVIPCVQVALLLGVGSIFFDMPLGESPLWLAPLSLVVALVATALGMLVAALAKTAKQADSIGVLLGLILAAIGGAVPLTGVPTSRVGGFMGTLAKLTPHAYAVEAYYKLMVENAPFVQVLPEVGILLAMGAVFFLVAAWRFKFD
ncbi:MAG: ABC transporter permease [Anaerolineae bacterium]|jgi:ABC-2 type transport system permease protein